jgi:hypothetical protein
MEKLSEGVKAKLEASFVEIYNENAYDLLLAAGPTPGSASKSKPREAERARQAAKLKIREDQQLGPYVEGKTTLPIKDIKAMHDVLARGNAARHVSATEMCEQSSRSHTVFTLILRQMVMIEGRKATKVSALNFVDLGGTGQGDGNVGSKQERLAASKADPVRLAEGASINRSLTTLGMVITALGKQSKDPSASTHVPYRDSALTWLLKGALGGNSKTLMIATLSPSQEHYEESISTLRQVVCCVCCKFFVCMLVCFLRWGDRGERDGRIARFSDPPYRNCMQVCGSCQAHHQQGRCKLDDGEDAKARKR